MHEKLIDEDEHLATREEQLVRKLGLTRRPILTSGTAGALLIAGLGRFAAPARAVAADAPASPIVKPWPPKWINNDGTNAEPAGLRAKRSRI